MPPSRPVSREGSFESRPLSSASMTSLGTMSWSMIGDDAPRRLSGGWLRVDQPFDLSGEPQPAYYAHPQKLVAQYAEPEEVLAQRKLSMQLVRAARTSGADAIDKLLNEGADVDFTDPMGVSPTMSAAQAGNLDALKRLLKESPDLTLVNEDGRSALHLAVLWGQCIGEENGCIGALVRAGCSRGATDYAGQFPVDLMCRALTQPKMHKQRMKLMAPLKSLLNCRAINTSDFDEIFEDSDDPFVVQEQLGAQAVNVFGLKERAYAFGVVEKGETRQQRIKISNTGTLPCVVALTVTPKSENFDMDTFPISIEPKTLTIQERGCEYATLSFTAGASGKIVGVVTAEAGDGQAKAEPEPEPPKKGAKKPPAKEEPKDEKADGETDNLLKFEVRAEVPRDPNEPEPDPPKKGGKKPAPKKKK